MLKLTLAIALALLLQACSDKKPASRTEDEQAAADQRFDKGKPADRKKNKEY